MRWRTHLLAVLVLCALVGQAQEPKSPATLKSTLLQQLRETHNEKNWFVSEKEAVAGLTGEQAAWSDGKNHSVGQLLNHLAYWNDEALSKAVSRPAQKKIDNNDETFVFDPKNWADVQKHFDEVMTGWENFVQSADDAALAKAAPTVARIAQHNAYHIGEMVTS